MSESLLDPRVYQSIKDIVYRKAGINLGEGKQSLVHARLGKRLRALVLPDHAAYLDYLLADDSGEEIVQLLDVISTNFTSFWREPQHFEELGRIIKDLSDQGQTKFRVWCTAASSGEEPYTLSMTCLNALGNRKADLKILCTDISTKVLRICKIGRYEASRLKPLPVGWAERWFQEDSEDPAMLVAGAAVRAPLTFARLNLMEAPYPMSGPFDAIFCRNVMIYFDNDGRRKIIKEANRLLKEEGYLFTGHAESLSGLGLGFRAIRPSVYRKVEAAK